MTQVTIEKRVTDRDEDSRQDLKLTGSDDWFRPDKFDVRSFLARAPQGVKKAKKNINKDDINRVSVSTM